jgi:hypothetical protein
MEQFGQTYISACRSRYPLGEVPTTVLLLPPNEPELTTTGLSDKTKAPIILELLEVEVG